MEQLSISDTSSSSTSKTSKVTISPDIVALGETPIVATLWKQFLLAVPDQCFTVFYQLVEFKYIGMYCGMNNIALYAFLMPFVLLLNQMIPLSLSYTCGNFVNKSIIQSQYTSANIFFAYYFVACMFLNAVVVIIGQVLLKRFYSTPTSNLYFQLAFGVFPFLESFTFGLDKFYAVENRNGLITLKSFVNLLTTMFVFPLVMNLNNGGDRHLKQGLDYVAVAYLVNYIIYLPWSLMVVMRAKMPGLEYAGVLKFSFRRLRPFKIKFVIHLYANCISSLLPNMNLPLAFMIIQLIMKYSPTVDFDLNMFFFRDYLVYMVTGLMNVVHNAFSISFYRIASYNVSIKKLARTYDFFRYALLFNFICSTAATIIVASLARYITRALIPIVLTPTRNKVYETENCYFVVIMTSVSSIPACLMKIAGQFFRIENNVRAAMLVQLPSLLYAAAAPLLLRFSVGKACNLCHIVAAYEFVNAMVGIPLICLHNRRYKGLKRAEIERQHKVEEASQSENQYTQLRESVIYAFNEQVQAEDELMAVAQPSQPQYYPPCASPSDKLGKLSGTVSFQSVLRQFEQGAKFGGSVLRRSTPELELPPPSAHHSILRGSQLDNGSKSSRKASETNTARNKLDE